MFGLFQKKAPRAPARPSSGNRIEDLLDRLYDEGREAETERTLEQVKRERLRPEETASWHVNYGIEAFKRGDRDTAYQRYQQGLAECPDAPDLAFLVGQEHQHRGLVGEAFGLFDRALFPAISPLFALHAIRYAYLWDELDRGLRYLQPLLDAYREIRILDDHYLWSRNIPFFGDVWSTTAALLELKGDLDTLTRLTRDFEANCDDSYDFTVKYAYLNALRQGDNTPILQLESLMEPSDYWRTNQAIQRSLNAASFDAALAEIDGITLGPDNLDWLADMLRLACGAAAHRFGQPEDPFIEPFLQQQELLFEPYHAFDFRMVAYQEVLKPTYQYRHRAAAA